MLYLLPFSTHVDGEADILLALATDDLVLAADKIVLQRAASGKIAVYEPMGVHMIALEQELDGAIFRQVDF